MVSDGISQGVLTKIYATTKFHFVYGRNGRENFSSERKNIVGILYLANMVWADIIGSNNTALLRANLIGQRP